MEASSCIAPASCGVCGHYLYGGPKDGEIIHSCRKCKTYIVIRTGIKYNWWQKSATTQTYPLKEDEPVLAWDDRGYMFFAFNEPCQWFRVPAKYVWTYRNGRKDHLVGSTKVLELPEEFITWWDTCRLHGTDCKPK
jgi:hypothetical protein